LDEFKIYIKKEELYKIINGNFSLLLDIQNKNKEESTFFNYYKNNLLNIKNILKSKKEIGLNNKEFEEKNNCKSDINIQLNKLKDELNEEKNKNKNYEQNMKDLNNERKKNNELNENINILKKELDLKNKELEEIELKASKFQFELS
jgi:hypothetical protein